MEYKHTSVMPNEVLEFLNLKSGQFIVDCTLGGAGHSIDIAERIGPNGRLLSFDLDEMAIDNAKRKIEKSGLKNIKIINDNFSNLVHVIKENLKQKTDFFHNWKGIDGILFDLGLSSAQLDDRRRGFSFQGSKPLNMGFSEKLKDKTIEIINTKSAEELEKIFHEYGEERFSKKIAQEIIKERKIKQINDTAHLVDIIKKAIPNKIIFGRDKKIHFATKVFQALRIETNSELDNLKTVLPESLKFLNKGARIVVISYHSLEDRIVKNFFRDEARGCVCPPEFPICVCGHKSSLKIINKKIITPTEAEIKKNPRARSAKMRVAEKI